MGVMAFFSAELVMGATPDDVLADHGFVDVGASDTTIVVELMYARPDNFVGEVMYRGLTRAFLHRDAWAALRRASEILREEHPGLRLKVCDAARPMSVQQRMYDKVRHTPMAPYVSNPANGGGLHNYGLAVDITLVDTRGRELPMGTPVDFLGPEANIDKEEELVAAGKMTEQERCNRRLLRDVMTRAGFKPLRTEWWHFNLMSRDEARRRYKRLDF